MIINRVIHAATWPPRQVGLDPHGDLNNAKPDLGRARAARSGSDKR